MNTTWIVIADRSGARILRYQGASQGLHLAAEIPHPEGPYGAKGFAEMTANVQIPAITAAVRDAIGVWITQFPITPELILEALESKETPGRSSRPVIRKSRESR